MIRFKIKNPIYNLNFCLGYICRKRFMRRATKLPPIQNSKKCDITVYSTTGKDQFPEQIVSVRNFIRNVGVPEQFIIFSDGTLTNDDKKFLESIHSCIKCRDISTLGLTGIQGEKELLDFISSSVFITKLKALMNLSLLPGNRLYLDSDVLMFPSEDQETFPEGNYSLYLKDGQYCMDDRLILDAEKTLDPINAGFVLFRGHVDWSIAAERAAKISSEAPVHFSEQTLLHLTLHHSGAKAFDPQKFIMHIDDLRKWEDAGRSSTSVMRHYVGPVRHKFWLLPSHFYS